MQALLYANLSIMPWYNHRQVLEAHPIHAQRVAEGKPPANVVLLRGCGSRLALQVRPAGWSC